MRVSRLADYKAPGGKLVRIRLAEIDGEIESISISGDFFLTPEEQLAKLEKVLIGAPLREKELNVLIERFFTATKTVSLGVTPDDFVRAIVMTVPEGKP